MAVATESRRWLVWLIFICFQASHHLIDSYTDTYWQSPLQIFEYKSFRSVRILQFTIPTQTTIAAWVFNGLVSDRACEERVAEIVLQHGSYPLVTPHNETFPPYFNTHRTGLKRLRMNINGSHLFYSTKNPLPGSIYAAMYLIGKKSHKFKQKGLSKDCQYFLSAVQEVKVIGQILELSIGVHTALNVSNIRKQFKFRSTELTWQYRLNFTKCTFTPPGSDNVTDAGPGLPCPLRVAVSGRALAHWEDSGSQLNCTDRWEGDTCSLTVTSPFANAWQFMELSLDVSGMAHFTVHIEVSECDLYPSNREIGKAKPMRNTSLLNSTSIMNNTAQTSTSVMKPELLPVQMSLNSDLTFTVFNFTEGEDMAGSVGVEGAVEDTTDDLSSVVSAQVDPTEPSLFDESPLPICTRIPSLGRYQRAAFDVQFTLRMASIPLPNKLLITYSTPVVLAFAIKPIQDSGGTLKYQLDLLSKEIKKHTDYDIEVVSCIQLGRIPMNENGVHCEPENQLNVNLSHTHSRAIYFPYPESGTWYIAMLTRCYNESTEVDCEMPTQTNIGFVLNISPCVDTGCGLQGKCREYFSGVLHFSACACTADWRGYGCTDGTVAESDSLQLLSTLLLSLSNLAFVPAIIVALHRRFFVEALVYTYTMFFSTFYHACDGDSRHVWCMMPYKVLSHCDFFGAILSFWVTLVSMARLPERARSFLFILAALALAVGVQWDRHSLWTFLVPAGSGLAVMLATWTYRCHSRKVCYPTKRRWMLYIVPGLAIAVIGLITFAFFETSRNYKYTHSLWHSCMALCIVFILPPRCVASDKDDPPTDSPLNYNTYETVSILPQGSNPNRLVVNAR